MSDERSVTPAADKVVATTPPAKKRKPASDLDQLQTWVVIVLLGLLVFVTVANVADDFWFGNKFIVDNGFYILVGGMITGLFTSKAIASRNGKDE